MVGLFPNPGTLFCKAELALNGTAGSRFNSLACFLCTCSLLVLIFLASFKSKNDVFTHIAYLSAQAATNKFYY